MATTSPIQGVPLPEATDPDNVPYDLAQAVGFMEKRLVMVFADAATRDATIAAPEEGMTAYLQATDTITAYLGTAWVPVLTRNSFAGNGSATTAARSDHSHDPAGYSVAYATSAGDADTVDGQHAAAFATAGHGHDVSGASVAYASNAGTLQGNGPGAFATAGHGHGYMAPNGSYTMTAQYPFTFPSLTTGSTYNVTLSSGMVMQRSSSARRFKKDIADLEVDVVDLYALQPREFRYDNDHPEVDSDDRLMGGFIAEEVDEVFPLAVLRDPATGEVMDLHDRTLIAGLMAMIRDLNDRLVRAGL